MAQYAAFKMPDANLVLLFLKCSLVFLPVWPYKLFFFVVVVPFFYSPVVLLDLTGCYRLVSVCSVNNVLFLKVGIYMCMYIYIYIYFFLFLLWFLIVFYPALICLLWELLSSAE